MQRMTARLRVKGALYGALTGDALGVPYEFHAGPTLPPRGLIEMTPPANFRRAHQGTPVGTWSDDGAQMLALLDSLLVNPGLDLRDFASRLVDWHRHGAYTPDGRVFDIGNQTSVGLANIERGENPERSGPSGERHNGNGALMRVLPVAFFSGPDAETIRLARLQGLPTHAHVRSQLTSAYYALIAKRLLAGEPRRSAVESAGQVLLASVESSHAHEARALVFERKRGHGSGYVVDCFYSALDCLENTESFEDCVKTAVAMGDDTDTTACVAGGLAGALYGWYAIPQRWQDTLRGTAIVEALLARLPP